MVSFNEMWIRYARGYKTSGWSLGVGGIKLHGYELYEREVLVGKVEISYISGVFSALIEATGFRFNYDMDATTCFVSHYKTWIKALIDNPNEITVEVFRGNRRTTKTLGNDRIIFDGSWDDMETAFQRFLQIRKILLDTGF